MQGGNNMKMKACLLDGFHQDFHWEDDIEIIEPRANEIRVKIVSCGLCHTERAEQVNLWGLGLPFPIVLGHEGAGIVESVGPGVSKFKVGDKVAMSTPWCGTCPACASGQPWACEHTDELEIRGVDYFGTPGPLSRNGKPVYTFFNQSALAEYSTIHINNCTKLPDDFDLRIAGPLGCGFRTGAGAVYNVCKPKLNEWVIITGTGAVGFAAMWTAKAMGAKTVMVEVKAGEDSVTFTIKTDKETVGEALQEHGLIEGEDGAYGLYVKKVNGIVADYDEDQTFWAFYINGEYAMTGVDGTLIEEGVTYQLIRSK